METGEGLPWKPTEPCSTVLGGKVMGSIPEGAHLSLTLGGWGLRWPGLAGSGGSEVGRGELVPPSPAAWPAWMALDKHCLWALDLRTATAMAG